MSINSRSQRNCFPSPASVGGAALAAFLVRPVGGNAEFGLLVHPGRPDLDLDAVVLGADHGGVKAAVAVGLGRNVVLEAPRHVG